MQLNGKQPYGQADAARDEESGYPASFQRSDNVDLFAKARVGQYGEQKTEFDVATEADALLEQ